MSGFSITLSGVEELEQELNRLSSIRWEAIREKQVIEMLNRARAPGGTPVKSGEMRIRTAAGKDEMGYLSEYAPHVEFGHRQQPGRYVPAIGKRLKASYVEGQHFLQANVDAQRPIYREDLRNAIRKETE